jgi:hypothetical protein
MKTTYLISCVLAGLIFASYSANAADEAQGAIGIPAPPMQQQRPVNTPAEDLSVNKDEQHGGATLRRKMTPALPPPPTKNVIIDQGGSLKMVPQTTPVTKTPVPAMPKQ